MTTSTNSLLNRLGIFDSESLPVNPKIRWNSNDPVWTMKIESGVYDNNFDSEHDFDLDCFGMTEEEACCEEITDEEFEELIIYCGF